MEIEANGTFYYKDIHGRPVFVDYEYIRDAGFVVLIDRSDAQVVKAVKSLFRPEHVTFGMIVAEERSVVA